MILFFSITVASLVLFFLAYNVIATTSQDRLKRLQEELDKVAEHYARLNEESKKLKTELADLEKQVALQKNNIKHSSALAAAQIMTEPETSKEERLANHMVNQGIITNDQYEKAMAMQTKLQMDFVTICMTMGFICEEDAASLAHKNF